MKAIFCPHGQKMHSETLVLRQDGWKLLYSSGSNELYNFNDDSLEKKNLIEQQLDTYITMLKDFYLWREHHREENKRHNQIKLNSQLIENLRKLSYWLYLCN